MGGRGGGGQAPIILNVAEKNDAAKGISAILSRGNSNRREGLSPFNKLYCFSCTFDGGQADMIVTSVSGHLLAQDFPPQYSNWMGTRYSDLFDAPIRTYCPDNFTNIKRTLEREARRASHLVIWTDCDREGEAIGYEIISVCLAVNARLRVKRARFSEITATAIWRALNNLVDPDPRLNDAVLCRSELDLRTGAAFTRLQSIILQRQFPQHLIDAGTGRPKLVSYGSCQFPTLGFVVERYKARENFQSEPFWKLRVTHTRRQNHRQQGASEDGGKISHPKTGGGDNCSEAVKTEFGWNRNRLFVEAPVQALLEICQQSNVATVTSVRTKPKSRWRPLPLDTVEMEKLGVRKLRLTAKRTLELAEKLYTKGFISYPRTETNTFPENLDLRPLVQSQAGDPRWTEFAQGILDDQGGPNPRRGNKSDQAHPPIHPLKAGNGIEDHQEAMVYEFIARHFLAVCSRDATGSETVVEISVAIESFTGTGLVIYDRGYMEVYPWDSWNAKTIGNYQEGEQFRPDRIDKIEGSTSAPPLLTEADLITLMDKHGIGTDATHAQHIETIINRSYVGLNPENRFIPGYLGLGLVNGYNAIGHAMAHPKLRSEFEADLVAICEGRKTKTEVLAQYTDMYRLIFFQSEQAFQMVVNALRQCFAANNNNNNQQPAAPPAAPGLRGGRGGAAVRGGRGARGGGGAGGRGGYNNNNRGGGARGGGRGVRARRRRGGG